MYQWMIAIALTATAFLPAADPFSLSVRGYAALSQPANQLRISVGVVTQGKNAQETLNANNEKMHQLIQALTQAGLKEGEYQTGRFSVRPLYSQRPKDPPADWSPKIVGFEVSNTLAVSTDKIEEAGSLIDKAANAGANNIDSITFEIKDPQKHRDALIQAAAKNALADAESLSQAAGVKLLRILSISVDDAQEASKRPFMMKAMAAPSVPIVSGDIEMSASVTVIYQIN